jgi:hypothetical protein
VARSGPLALAGDARELGGQLFPQSGKRGVVGGGLEVAVNIEGFAGAERAHHESPDPGPRHRGVPRLERRG